MNVFSLSGVNNVSINGFRITGATNGDGIHLFKSQYNNISNNIVNSNKHGIVLESSSNNTVANNNASSNTQYGFYLISSSTNNSLYYNTANRNERGFDFYNSSSNIISGNNVSENSAHGMWISYSNFNTIVENRANNTSQGIDLDSSNSNVVARNIVAANSISGLYMCKASHNNTVFNNYLNNTLNANINNPNNIWNITKTAGSNIVQGSYLGGNFWAKSVGAGFSEMTSDADKDGIADSAYVGTNLTDYLPLVYVTPEPPLVVAKFTANTTSGTAPLTVKFTGSSENATDSEWNFGDGTDNSTEKNPKHTFLTEGNFNVVLTAINGTVNNSTSTTITVSKAPEPSVVPVANFTSNISEGNAPLTVQFNNTHADNSTTWNWDFGDGSYSTEPNPIHTYSAPGNYTVSLRATNTNGVNPKNATLIAYKKPVLPVADFDTGDVHGGYSPFTMSFKDLSKNATGWYWDFGDGATSAEQNPTHTFYNNELVSYMTLEYPSANYLVTLTAINENGTDNKSQDVTIYAEMPYSEAMFDCTPEEKNPLSVQFTDHSDSTTDMVMFWNWDFGDGTTSREQNPVHTYQSPGNYTVTLIATGEWSQSTTSKVVSIVELRAPVADFSASPIPGVKSLKVKFTDMSTDYPSSWYWDFGDGSTLTAQNPAHIYSSAGNYTVNLTVSNGKGADSKLTKIIVPETQPFVGEKQLAYITVENGISVIDTSTNNVIDTVPVDYPSGIAVLL